MVASEDYIQKVMTHNEMPKCEDCGKRKPYPAYCCSGCHRFRCLDCDKA